MLDIAQISHFRTFGYVVLSQFIEASLVRKLREEVDQNLNEAFSNLYQDPPLGIPGLLLPTMSEKTPLGMSLLADDPQMWDAAHLLLGAQAVPLVAEANCFFRNAGWHADYGQSSQTVKFMAYLDTAEVGDGALEVLPGSHLPTWQPQLREFLAASPVRRGNFADSSATQCGWDMPSVALRTKPGDVIAFTGTLLHRSSGGHRRLAWNAQYAAEPPRSMETERRLLRALVVRATDTSGFEYDRSLWPMWTNWMQNSGASATRATAIARLKGLGIPGLDPSRGGRQDDDQLDDSDGSLDWLTGVPHWAVQRQAVASRSSGARESGPGR